MSDRITNPAVRKLLDELGFGEIERMSDDVLPDDDLFNEIMGKYPEYVGVLVALAQGTLSYEKALADAKPLHAKIMAEYITALKVKHGAV